jgi:recombination protein RecA
MASAILLRAQLEASLADRIPGAFTPKLRQASETLPTGVHELDAILEGGVPRGGITEIVGGSTTGRTALALSILSRATQKGAACAWVDVADAFDPESAAARGVILERLLWLRSGGEESQDYVQGPSFTRNRVADPLTEAPQAEGWVHPRNETRTLDRAIPQLFQGNGRQPQKKSPSTSTAGPKPGSLDLGPQSTELHPPRGKLVAFDMKQRRTNMTLAEPATRGTTSTRKANSWMCLDQLLRATDLLLQAGGFSAIVMDMSDLRGEQALRIPIALWHRFRLAAEQAQTTLLVLTPTAAAKSCATLVLRCERAPDVRRWRRGSETALFVGLKHRTTVERNRNEGSDPFRKKLAGRVSAEWETRAPWAGIR